MLRGLVEMNGLALSSCIYSENMIEELHEEMAAQGAPPAEKPHQYQEIMDNLIKPKDRPAPDKLLSEHQYTDYFDAEKKKSYWVDEDGKNCFMLYAKDLTIIWSGDRRYWRWSPLKVTRDASVDVAELLDVCWLDVNGAFDTKYLTPDTVYEVSFVIRLKDPNYGWEDNVNFSLTLPGNDKKTFTQDLRKLPRGSWSIIRVGEFKPPRQSGRMDFTLRQTVPKWKKGLVILGVDISPKL
ncbi:hypothetical protein TB1_036452 [Malus domestica]|uniref:Uncharacterized protein n=2 Tax=Malus TaxID=3749 RepID=A0A498JVH3_MALDO|nr:hypothetical protein DVH24_011775 [Malus domestica]